MTGGGRTPLLQEVAVEPHRTRPGWFRGNLSTDWNFRSPSGGVVQCLTVSAMRAALGESAATLLPRSVTTIFCSVVPAGPVDVQVETLRRGNAAVQLRAVAHVPGEPGPALESIATFAVERQGPDFTDAGMPDGVSPPNKSAPLQPQVPFAPDVVPEFFKNFETRKGVGANFWEPDDWQAGSGRYARWVRYLEKPVDAHGQLDVLAFTPIADTMPPAVVQYLGSSFEPFIAPSLDLTVHFLQSTDRDWLLCSAHARRARGGYASAEIEIWDDVGALLAFGTQTMILRKVPEALLRR